MLESLIRGECLRRRSHSGLARQTSPVQCCTYHASKKRQPALGAPVLRAPICTRVSRAGCGLYGTRAAKTSIATTFSSSGQHATQLRHLSKDTCCDARIVVPGTVARRSKLSLTITTHESERRLADPGASIRGARRVKLTNRVRSIDLTLGITCSRRFRAWD